MGARVAVAPGIPDRAYLSHGGDGISGGCESRAGFAHPGYRGARSPVADGKILPHHGVRVFRECIIRCSALDRVSHEGTYQSSLLYEAWTHYSRARGHALAERARAARSGGRGNAHRHESQSARRRIAPLMGRLHRFRTFSGIYLHLLDGGRVVMEAFMQALQVWLKSTTVAHWMNDLR